MSTKFIYFDLGNVLLYFDQELSCRQMSEVTGVPQQKLWDIVFESGLKWRYEAGELSRDEYHQQICEQAGITADFAALELAGSAIFTVNATMLPIVSKLEAAGHRLGILSNICPSHWKYVCDDRYGILPGAFSVHALSFELKAIKPDPKIFHAAAQLAGVAPEEIFYMDDIQGHVDAAKSVGFDAVQYTTTAALVDELRKRGLRFNY